MVRATILPSFVQIGPLVHSATGEGVSKMTQFGAAALTGEAG